MKLKATRSKKIPSAWQITASYLATKPVKAKVWRLYLPIPAPLRANEAPSVDLLYLLERGIDGGALAGLGLLRREVLSLVRRLQRSRKGKLLAFHFLVHDRNSGVKCPPEDPGAYLDLTLWFSKKITTADFLPPPPHGWVFVHPREPESLAKIAGVDADAISIQRAWTLLNEQSAWYLRAIESFGTTWNTDTIVVLRHMRQFLHYFANMAQMRIQ